MLHYNILDEGQTNAQHFLADIIGFRRVAWDVPAGGRRERWDSETLQSSRWCGKRVWGALADSRTISHLLFIYLLAFSVPLDLIDLY